VVPRARNPSRAGRGKLVPRVSRLREGISHSRSPDLLEKVTWTDDGWVKDVGRDVPLPCRFPQGGAAVKSGMPLSDDFSTDASARNGLLPPDRTGRGRYRYEGRRLVLKAGGTSPKDSP
jgi:xylan 1,4-beta-xylosidase